MKSTDIAKLTRLRHFKVINDLKKVFGKQFQTTYIDSLNRERLAYDLDKKATSQFLSHYADKKYLTEDHLKLLGVEYVVPFAGLKPGEFLRFHITVDPDAIRPVTREELVQYYHDCNTGRPVSFSKVETVLRRHAQQKGDLWYGLVLRNPVIMNTAIDFVKKCLGSNTKAPPVSEKVLYRTYGGKKSLPEFRSALASNPDFFCSGDYWFGVEILKKVHYTIDEYVEDRKKREEIMKWYDEYYEEVAEPGTLSQFKRSLIR